MDKNVTTIADLNEIGIAIDTWDDIFSDFDPSPLNERTLSEDFIVELKKRYRETSKGVIAVIIYAPVSLKDEKAESIVTQRIKRHFKHRFLQSQKEIVRIRIKGIIFVLFGIVFLTCLTLVAYFKIFSSLAIEILGIVVMPLGWFGVWEGFSKIVDTSPKSIQEETLFDKFSKAQYKFKFLEEAAK